MKTYLVLKATTNYKLIYGVTVVMVTKTKFKNYKFNLLRNHIILFWLLNSKMHVNHTLLYCQFSYYTYSVSIYLYARQHLHFYVYIVQLS